MWLLKKQLFELESISEEIPHKQRFGRQTLERDETYYIGVGKIIF